MKLTIVLFFVTLVFMGCQNNKSSASDVFKSIDKQGHRGCRGLMPENTLAAFKKAIDLGVNTLEMDVVISGDSQVVVSHENYFNYETTTKPNGETLTKEEQEKHNLYKMSYSEIRRYDVGLKYNPNFPIQKKEPAYKPLLADLIDSVELYAAQNNKPTLHYNIETKLLPETDSLFHPGPERFSDLVMAVLVEKKLIGRVIVESFDKRSIKYIHQKYPSLPTSLLVEDYDTTSFAKHLEELGYIPYAFSPAKELVNPELIKACHENGIKILPWTVNDREMMVRFTEMGVDGIISDYPNLFFE